MAIVTILVSITDDVHAAFPALDWGGRTLSDRKLKRSNIMTSERICHCIPGLFPH